MACISSSVSSFVFKRAFVGAYVLPNNLAMLRHRTPVTSGNGGSRNDDYCFMQTRRTFWSSDTEYARTSSSSFENREALGVLSAAKRFSQERR